MKQKRIRISLIVLEVFVALGAVGGGIGLLTGAIPASLNALQGSPFVDYTIPALLLIVIVGGSMFLAAATILMGREIGVLLSATAGLGMMIFEIVEVVILDHTSGNMLGFALSLQIFYFTLGLVIFGLSCFLWLTDYRRNHFSAMHISLKQ
ncbi:hypothetical protein KDA_40530 [Dictyobacter alpinus]|uniref:Uncharacterized protein n=1 Tax=Dictyobacter alpinus TaxID=2014873 RepID=A0A402BB61_9CHLR|nr:hypothetical protein [Dictyobacter alpinus]GCE28569.1 hypothetical protein KDA_40530 [Dictyobacter alpinus]